MQIIILVSLVTISGILLVVLSRTIELASESKVLDQSVDGELLAGSAVRRVEVAIEDPSDDLETRILAAAPAYPLQISGTTVSISIEAESGKINPVLTAPAIMDAYIAPLALDPEQRRALMSELELARTAKKAARAIEALARYLPPTVSYDHLQSDFSVLNATSGVDPMSANDRVLSALPDVGAGRLEEIHKLRRLTPSALQGLSPYFTGAQPIFTIVATVNRGVADRYTLRVPIQISTAGHIIPLDGFL